MPVPVVLEFLGRSRSAVAAGEQTVATIKTVARQQAASNAELRAQAKALIEQNVQTARSAVTAAAEMRQASRERVRDIGIQIDAIKELRRVSQKGTDEYAAAKAVEAKLVKEQIALEGELGAARKRAGAAGLLGGGGGARSAERGALGAAERRAEARGIRGAIGEGTRELGFGRLLGGPSLVAGFIGGAAIAESIKLALTAQQAQAQLRNALKNSGESWAANRHQIEETLKEQEKLSGFTREDLTAAYTSLVQRLGSTEKANRSLAIATNLSRGAHIDLGRAVTIVTRANQGNVGQLARLGINIPKVTTHMDALREAHIKVGDANRAQVIALTRQAQALDKQATATQALDQIERKYHDDALTRSKTLAGQMDALKNRFIDWAVVVGEKALPYAEQFFRWLNHIIDAITKQHRALAAIKEALTDFATGVSVIVKGVVALWDAMSHGQKVLAVVGVALVAFTALAEANPFIMIATSAVVAIGLIHRHWATISEWFKALWDKVRTVFLDFWDWLRIRSIQAALDAVEPFSHLPGRLGGWARKAKTAMNDELAKIKDDAAARGAEAGDAYGRNFMSAAAKQINADILAGNAPSLAGSVGGSKQVPIRGGSGVVVPTDIGGGTPATHQTAGLPGFPSVDIFATPGTKVLAPEDGEVQDVHFIEWNASKRIGGWTLYYQGHETGNTYFMTHLANVTGAGSYSKGDVIALIATVPGGMWKPHVHVGEHQGTYTPGTGGSTSNGFNSGIDSAKKNEPKKKVRHSATVVATTVESIGHSLSQAVARFSDQLEQHDLVSNAWEQRQVAKLERLRASIHAGMKPADLRHVQNEIKATTDLLGGEIEKRVRAHEKEERAAKKVRDAYNRTVESAKALASSLVSAGTPGRADPTSAVNSALSTLTGLGGSPDSRAQQIVARIAALRERLSTLKNKPGDASIVQRIRAEIVRWGNALAAELTRQADKAQIAQDNMQRRMERGWRDLLAGAQRAFDAETQRADDAFDAVTSTHLSQMEAEFKQRIANLQVLVNTAYGSFTIGAGGLTPAEQQLKDLQATAEETNLDRTLSDARDALRRATLIGDPGQIRDAQRAVEDAQRAIDESRLQQQATDERTAADKALQDQQDLLQAQYDAQVKAYQDQRSAERASYDQARADQWQHIQDELDDWRYMIDTKQKTYADFLRWYAKQSLGSVPTDLTIASGGLLGQQIAASSPFGSPEARVLGAGVGSSVTIGNIRRPGVQFQTGGYVRTPTDGTVASHEPEFVVPESWLTPDMRDTLMNILASRRAPGASIRGSIAGGVDGFAGGGSGGLMIYAPVFVGGNVATERQLSLNMRDHLVKLGLTTGGNLFGGQA